MAAIFGVICCLGAGGLHRIRRSCEEAVEYYNSATPVEQLKDLGQLLKTANKVLVKIYGKVRTDYTPVNCKLSGLKGVIVKETAYQNFFKQDDKGKWIKDRTEMLSTCEKVPWYLDDGSARVDIVGPYPSTGLLQLSGEAFEGPGRSLVYPTCDCVKGPKILGVTRIERVLPIGARLTIVGKAVKEDDGTFTIYKPDYVSHGNISVHGFTGDYRMCASFFKYASIGLAAIGFYLIASHAFEFILDKKPKRKPPDNEGSNGTRMDDEQMPVICAICLDQEYNSVFVPCGHMCVTCSSKFTSCPLCQSQHGQVVKTF
ncbi:putative transcription factor C2H2 family [Helianthus annuus]|nr:putative transcription factor C2H2 family [Helianthus annuus]KAJ0471626.1 putative transcription factor C2H2 family [Helianthus annuus]